MTKSTNDIVDKIVNNLGKAVDKVIPILQAIQSEYNYLPEEALQRVCEITDITPSRIYSVSTFYSQFRHKPVGKHMISVCVGTACHVKGAMLVYEAFRRELRLKDGEETDSEGIFTVDKVACLGCCTIAPVVQIDNVSYGHVTTDQIPEIIEDFLTTVNDPAGKHKIHEQENANIQGEIRIGLGSCCVASGSSDVKLELEKTLINNNIAADVKRVGCVGICNQVPMIEIHIPGQSPAIYTKINADEIRNIVLKHFKPVGFISQMKSRLNSIAESVVYEGIPVSAKHYSPDERNTPVYDFLEGQINIATEHRGVLKPSDFEEYSKLGGIEALRKCLIEMSPDKIIGRITSSGLKGRGGAGFPTGVKWKLVRDSDSDIKYVICNGDEGDPGAFMDRMLLESYPFRIIEGMIIAGYAVGASSGLLYIRAEYKLAVEQITNALITCKEKGLIGENILGSGYNFNIELFEGAGAFICGEETALIASVEGNRGFPRIRPPYPSESGLWNQPTLINNAETLSTISWIIRNGPDAFSNTGTQNSKGTKVFALAGKIKRGGLIEVPMGTTLNQIVNEIGGGIANNKSFKAVQIGGPSGGCIPSGMADISVDYESLIDAGAMMGSGGLIVLDETDCMVDIAKYFLAFTQDQSCGKCTFCRVGTKRMHEILVKISSGNGTEKDISDLENLARQVKNTSLCGLGKSAPNPVLSTLKYYRDEYEAHIKGKCPTGKCLDMITYIITTDCIGCTKCAQKCPSDAIEHKPHEQHRIDAEKCIKCDLCRDVCPSGAVIKV